VPPHGNFTARLGQMLRSLASQKSSGVLDVWSSQGRKRVGVSSGVITLISSPARKRFRLGDLLVAQGKLKESELEAALAEQRQERGKRLGAILVANGAVTQEDIHEVIRFQNQEEIYDLFIWDDGQFEFHAGETLDAELGEREKEALLSLTPSEVIEEAAKRSAEWKDIHARIGSMNSAFRLTEMGRRMQERATRSGKKLLSFVDEGNTVQDIVRKSFRGRYRICKALRELMDAGALEEVPRNELEGLAQKLSTGSRHIEAIGVYNKLLEFEQGDARRLSIMRKLEAAEERLLSKGERHLGMDSSEMRAVSRKSSRPSSIVAAYAAEVRQRRVLSPLTAALSAALILLLGVAVYAFPPLRRAILGEDLSAFRQGRGEAERLASQNKFAEALRVYQQFIDEGQRDGEGRARREMELLREKWSAHISRQVNEARALRLAANKLVKAKEPGTAEKYARALVILEDLATQEIPDSSRTGVESELRLCRRDQENFRLLLSFEEQSKQYERGLQLEERGRYVEARACYESIVGTTQPDARLLESSRQRLSALEQIENEALVLFEKGLQAEESGDIPGAEKLFEAAQKKWNSSKGGRLASEHLRKIHRWKITAQQLLHEGEALLREKEPKTEAAMAKFFAIWKNKRFRDLDCAVKAKGYLDKLAGQAAEATKLRRRADDLAKRAEAPGVSEAAAARYRKEAFRYYVDLLRKYPASRATEGIRLPVRIISVPSGAQVERDDRELGLTPLTISVGAEEKGTFVLSKRGFDPVKQPFVRLRQRVLSVNLSPSVAFAKVLGPRDPEGALRLARKTLRRRQKPPLVILRSDRKVYAVSAADGRVAWERKISPSLVGTIAERYRKRSVLSADHDRPVLAGSRVYVTGYETASDARSGRLKGRIFIFNAATGRELGALGLPKGLTEPLHSGPVAREHHRSFGDSSAARIFLAARGGIACLETGRDEARWRFPLPSSAAVGTPMVAAGAFLLAAGVRGRLWALPATERGSVAAESLPAWEEDLRNRLIAGPDAAEGLAVCAVLRGRKDAAVLLFDTRAGARKRRVGDLSVPDCRRASLRLVSATSIFGRITPEARAVLFLAGGTRVRAYKVSPGSRGPGRTGAFSEMWTRSLSDPVAGEITQAADRLFVGTARGEVCSLRVADGEIEWIFRIPTECCLSGSPLVVGEMLFVGTTRGTLYAVRLPPES